LYPRRARFLRHVAAPFMRHCHSQTMPAITWLCCVSALPIKPIAAL
jgi:hypothetical protein